MSSMKIGLGMYPGLLTTENFRFAQQVGATHIVAHLPGFARRESRGLPPERVWTYEELEQLKRAMNAEGLEFDAIENFEVDHWYDVLLDGPKRDLQMEGLKALLRTMGALDIRVMGYNFSYANCWGRVPVDRARGGAISAAYIQELAPEETEIPNGSVWDTVYDPDAPEGTIGTVTEEVIWERVQRFLEDLVPVAEEAGVRDFLKLQIMGNSEDLRQQLDDLLADIQVDELMFTIDIHDPDKRRQALDILAETRSPQTDSDATIN